MMNVSEGEGVPFAKGSMYGFGGVVGLMMLDTGWVWA